ncbi:MAG TPA: L,D-transpeptidase [Solirubrobacteraceae bacterium]|nr:L,D-transpeptidase [Solirubrobacteraceae bacterium]
MRPHPLGRVLIAGLAATCLLFATAGSTAGAATPTRVQATQELAVLLATHGAHQLPQAASPQVALVAARRPLTGEPTTLPVIARSIDAGGARWLQVMLPGRPNGSTGWIAERGTRPLVTAWRVVIDLATRRVRVYEDGRIARAFQAIVGKVSTPTPSGQFFVEETLRMPAGEAGGPFALALSARSDVLQEFEGGPGQIALHGRDNLGGTLGTAASHGCVRVATASIDWLAARMGPGTPVTIVQA